MKSLNKSFGQKGEEAAAALLKKRGYKILETNFRAPRGEIDIIAEQGGILVFMEVKARSGTRFGSPFDAVDARKQKKIIGAAEAYLAMRKITGKIIRFDVAAVDLDRDPPAVDIMTGAFTADPP